MSSSTFSQTRSQALNLEKQTETLLSKYSQFQNHVTAEPSIDESSCCQQITDILDKRDDTLHRLNRISETETISTSKLQQLTRHKEILQDHRQSFRKIQSQINEERNKTNLLFSVRTGIELAKARNDPGTNPNDYILDESTRVNNANNLADRLLQQAFETRDELWNQRQYLQNAQLKVLSSLLSIPGLNVLISKINTRRKRDTLILATVITLCILGLFFI
jgi:Golgi SNAP receptor complex protein 1